MAVASIPILSDTHYELSSTLSDTALTAPEYTLVSLSAHGSAGLWRFLDGGVETFELSAYEMKQLVAAYQIHQETMTKRERAEQEAVAQQEQRAS